MVNRGHDAAKSSASTRPHSLAPAVSAVRGEAIYLAEIALPTAPGLQRRSLGFVAVQSLFHSPARPPTAVYAHRMKARLNVALALLALVAGCHAAEMAFEATLDAAQQVGALAGRVFKVRV